MREVKYFATVKDIVPADEAVLNQPIGDYLEDAQFAQDKQVINVEPGSLHEIEDPIPDESKYPQSMRHTSVGKLRTAETTDDLI